MDAQRNAAAKFALKIHWDMIEENNDPSDWETRWFSVEVARQGYIGMLLRFAGTIMVNGPHQYAPALVALLSFEGGQLKPAAIYEVQSVYRFTSAEVGKNP